MFDLLDMVQYLEIFLWKNIKNYQNVRKSGVL